ncbi:hypothetical protein C8J56DRAFT_898236 [Mycena floridula]|nr:hypothetical protein C8J56DRAFT_898236 [Mycena floridula]
MLTPLKTSIRFMPMVPLALVAFTLWHYVISALRCIELDGSSVLNEGSVLGESSQHLQCRYIDSNSTGSSSLGFEQLGGQRLVQQSWYYNINKYWHHNSGSGPPWSRYCGSAVGIQVGKMEE